MRNSSLVLKSYQSDDKSCSLKELHNKFEMLMFSLLEKDQLSLYWIEDNEGYSYGGFETKVHARNNRTHLENISKANGIQNQKLYIRENQRLLSLRNK